MSDIIKKAELGRAHREMERVLAFGEVKHPGNKWKGQTIEYVMEHAHGHEASGMARSPERDEESGCHNLAHSIVRQMMALEKRLQEEDVNKDKDVRGGSKEER